MRGRRRHPTGTGMKDEEEEDNTCTEMKDEEEDGQIFPIAFLCTHSNRVQTSDQPKHHPPPRLVFPHPQKKKEQKEH